MSFYSYKNSGSTHCPCSLNGNEVLSGLNEKICIQVQRVYDSCLMQEQLKEQKVTLLSYGLVPTGNGSNCDPQENASTQPNMPITFESCRSTSTEGVIRNHPGQSAACAQRAPAVPSSRRKCGRSISGRLHRTD